MGDNTGRLILFLGGARSGKSTLAEKIASRHERVAYVATAEAIDEEMRERIAKHRETRPGHWSTFEVDGDLFETFSHACSKADAVIVDCMTVYAGRRMSKIADDQAIVDEAVRVATHAKKSGKTVLIVSNEVGMGVVPEYPAGRRYRDLLGIVNQRIAEAADSVLFTVAGIPVDIKALRVSE